MSAILQNHVRLKYFARSRDVDNTLLTFLLTTAEKHMIMFERTLYSWQAEDGTRGDHLDSATSSEPPSSTWEDGIWIMVKAVVSLTVFVISVLVVYLVYQRNRQMRLRELHEEDARADSAKESKLSEEERARIVKEKLKLVEWRSSSMHSSATTSSSTSESSEGVSTTSDSSCCIPVDIETHADEPADLEAAETDEEEEEEEENEHLCSICLIPYAEHEMLGVSNNCQHMFHDACIESWLLKNNGCPVCRRTYLDDDDATPEKEDV